MVSIFIYIIYQSYLINIIFVILLHINISDIEVLRKTVLVIRVENDSV